MPNKEYAIIMAESLRSKRDLLRTLVEKTSKQTELISKKEYEDVNWKQFDVLIQEKDNAIKRIEALDDGFEQLFQKMKDEMDGNRQKYADEIREMQLLIKEITDLGITLQAAEDRNRRDIERIMTTSKKEIKEAKKSIKVSNSYLSSMYRKNVAIEPSQIDHKK